MRKATFPAGTVLRRPITFVADHYGVYLGVSQDDEWVFELTVHEEDSGKALVDMITFDMFAGNKQVEVVKNPPDDFDPRAMHRRILELMDKDELTYDFLLNTEDDWNCESAAWYVAFGLTKRSSQVEAAEKAGGPFVGAGLTCGVGALLVGASVGLAAYGAYQFFSGRRRPPD